MATPQDFSDLKALFINCTLKKAPIPSHTHALMEVSMDIMKKNGVSVEPIRFVEYDVAFGIYPDMTEHGYEKDDWPRILDKVLKADILVIGSPIWLGERSSVCSLLIERLYSASGQLNDKGQYLYYGKTGGCIITGNEDGIKHVAAGVLYAMSHVGYTIPPHYDSLIAKLIAVGPTRDIAIRRLRRAVDETIIDGIRTNLPLHRRILQDPDFVSGNLSTKFLERLAERRATG